MLGKSRTKAEFCPGIKQSEIDKICKRLHKLVGNAIQAHYNTKNSTLVFGPIDPEFGARIPERYAEFDNIGEED